MSKLKIFQSKQSLRKTMSKLNQEYGMIWHNQSTQSNSVLMASYGYSHEDLDDADYIVLSSSYYGENSLMGIANEFAPRSRKEVA